MITVIIAGGSGTRLWPLSTPDYPKHLLNVNSDDKSLLQHTYERAKTISNKVYVITEAGHAHHIKDQLPELDDDAFVIEPARRGTANCYLAAINHVKKRHDENEAIAMLSADHFIRDTVGFAHSFKVASDVSEKEGRIVLVGVEPDHPATGFGYIQKDGIFDEDSLVYSVHSFKEKPDYNTALKFMKSGKYLWNCGYFVGSVKTFSNKIKAASPVLQSNLTKLKSAKDRAEFEKIYLDFDNDAIEFALMEKLDDLLVVPATFDWMDVGSFTDLHKAVGADKQGNYVGSGSVELEGVENSYIENHEEKPVAVIGLDNIVVVNTKSGVLVARKDLGQKVGEVAKRIAKKDSD
ncbi:MAG: mannose-1-phosphate guanylyltransferase [Candidatus Saccharibacteria bacterium]|nr:mannose-1-phosphate guanylyltransferase [Candidatus Saccharibacteria bacterium]